MATPATLVTGVRTVAAVVLAGVAAHQGSLKLLVIALAVYWAGDSLDGFVARTWAARRASGRPWTSSPTGSAPRRSTSV